MLIKLEDLKVRLTGLRAAVKFLGNGSSNRSTAKAQEVAYLTALDDVEKVAEQEAQYANGKSNLHADRT